MRWNCRKVAELVAKETEAPFELVWPIIQEFAYVTCGLLLQGDDVNVEGLGTFEWHVLAPTTVPNPVTRAPINVPSRRALKYIPSIALRKRKPMEKYGVELDTEKTKEAEESAGHGKCPVCGAELDEGGACPVHGTEPFEKTDDK